MAVTLGASVTTLVSSGVSSPCDGDVDSKFQFLYIASNTVHKIFKIDIAAKTVSTLAGSGTASSVDGTGAGATFNAPGCAAIDPNDQYLYVYEITGNRIRKVEISTGVVTTVATAVASSYAVALSVAPTNDYLYVPCSSNNILVRVKISDGTKNTVAGSGSAGTAAGTGTSATFNAPRGCTINKAGDTMYICDISGNKIRQVVLNGGGTNAGTVSNVAGSGTGSSLDGIGASATFNQPLSCCLDYSEKYLYVAEFAANRIRRIELATSIVTTVAGSVVGSVDGHEDVATFNGAGAIISGNINTYYVSDQANNRIRRLAITNMLPNNYQSIRVGDGLSTGERIR